MKIQDLITARKTFVAQHRSTEPNLITADIGNDEQGPYIKAYVTNDQIKLAPTYMGLRIIPYVPNKLIEAARIKFNYEVCDLKTILGAQIQTDSKGEYLKVYVADPKTKVDQEYMGFRVITYFESTHRG
ncbi:MAG: hypothetical protein HY094_04265 [Candidatus Melainabacteria bacterium]|nr:hypothetical protein [Candidatus Melainabacteria bacterium]